MEDGMINTGFDDLISSLKASGSPLSIAKLASICNVPSKTVLEWAHILEKDGKAEIINRFDGVYVSWASKPSSHERLSPLHTHQTSQQDFDAQISLAREREAKMAQEKQTPGAISTTSTIPTYTQAPIAPTSPAPIPSPSSTARPSSSAVPNAPITPKQQIDAARGELSALDNELSKV
ncbi:MAG: hypothetical protein NT051_04155, partial [Candidatus Micrarchaeota archaeon]|nr:hypothetical protein [Candidatus Micrarchaeota archaeon]